MLSLNRPAFCAIYLYDCAGLKKQCQPLLFQDVCSMMFYQIFLKAIIFCRQVKRGDEVECGVDGNRITQRLKLNSKVALITGICLAFAV